MRTTVAVIVLVATLTFGAVTAFTIHSLGRSAKASNDTLERFCRSTKNSVGADLSALRSGNPGAQRDAIRRITDDRIYFGDTSARICLKDKMPIAEDWSPCLFTNDVPCVLARTEKLYQLLGGR